MRSNTCPKCQGSMSEGFVPTVTTRGTRTVSSWVEGTPKKSLWLGLKLGSKARLEIQTWRCGRCGYLESYAKG